MRYGNFTIRSKSTCCTCITKGTNKASVLMHVCKKYVRLYSTAAGVLLVFGRPFVKRCALCYRIVLSVCLSVCPVCDVRALWPNGWTDQDETWHACRPRPWPHCVRWGPSSSPPKGHSPKFSAHICCSQMAARIKMPLDMEVGLCQCYFSCCFLVSVSVKVLDHKFFFSYY